MTFSLTNLDGVARNVDVRQLHNRSNVGAPGVLSWGTSTTDVARRRRRRRRRT